MSLASWLRPLKAALTRTPARRATGKRPARRWCLEALEDRTVPASRFTEFPNVPQPNTMITDADGTMWFQETAADGVTSQLARIDATGNVTPYPDVHPAFIAAGPSGRLWLTEWIPTTANYNDPNLHTQVEEIDTSGGAPTVLATYTLPDRPSPYGGPLILYDSGRNGVWFTTGWGRIYDAQNNQQQFGFLDAGTGSVQTFTSAVTYRTANVALDTVHQVLWLTATANDNREAGIERITLPVDPHASLSRTNVNAQWITDPNYFAARGLTLGPDGDVWATSEYPSGILKIDPTNGRLIARYKVPTYNSQPYAMVSDSAHNCLWFTEGNAPNIGRISTDGLILEDPIPSNNDAQASIALGLGSDNAVWFTEKSGNQVGRMRLSNQAPVATLDSSGTNVITHDSAGNLVATINEGVPLTFRATAAVPGDGDDSSLAYTWSLPNGSTKSWSDPTADYFFNDNGTYQVTLKVDDPFGGSANFRLTVTVNNVPPTVLVAPLPAPGGYLSAVTTDVSATGDQVSLLTDAAQLPAPDGRMVTLFTNQAGEYGFRFFNADGTNAGRVVITSPVTSLVSAEHLTLQGNKIIVAGHDTSGAVVLERFKADGSLDASFGVGASHSVSTGLDSSEAITVQRANGYILVAGSIGQADSTGKAPLAVLRYTADGRRDQSWNQTGKVTSPFPGYITAALAVQNDGKILVGQTDSLNFIVLRYDSSGSLDTGFGDYVSGNTGPQTGWNNDVAFTGGGTGIELTALALEPDGRIIAAGIGGLVRYQTNGRLDTSFGPLQDGVLSFSGAGSPVYHYNRNQSLDVSQPPTPASLQLAFENLYGGLDAPPVGVAVDPNTGAILVGGGYQFAVVRLNADGTLDTSFGPNQSGMAFYRNDGLASAMALQADGSVAMLGNNSAGIAVVRFTQVASHTVAGQSLAFTFRADDASWDDQAAGFVFTIDWGDGTPIQTIPRTPYNGYGYDGHGNRTSIDHTFAHAGTFTVSVRATDKDGGVSGLTSSNSFTVTIDALGTAGLQAALNGALLADPATGHATVNLGTGGQAAADAFMAVFAPNAPSPLQPPAGAAVPIDIVMTFAPGVSFTEETLAVPPGLRVQINGGDWHGGSPALTLASGNLTVTGATFVNATDAPTILVTGGRLTLRNDVIQESTGYGQVAIQVTGGTMDLGTASSPGGNTLNINGTGAFIHNAVPVPAVGDVFTVNGVPLTPSSLSGVAWEDFNDDGQVDFGEAGIRGVTITLTGTDDLGSPVSLSQTTDADGAYVFLGLRPGAYRVTETQPAGYLQGTDTVGTAGGSLAAADQFLIPLGPGVDGLNYNFGERPAAGGTVRHGQAAGIGFWNNKNGQALIKSFNGGTGHQLADWLAATLPNTFGARAGGNNLTGKSNADIAALFQQDFVMKGVKLDAQVLATALSVYATNATLDSTGVAAQYGFTVGGDGLGTATVNVGSDGDAFGVASNTTMTVMDVLLAADAQAVNGVLYGGSTTKRSHANDVFSAINQAGGL
jgi:uncharacterized delta-60 repeat protein